MPWGKARTTSPEARLAACEETLAERTAELEMAEAYVADLRSVVISVRQELSCWGFFREQATRPMLDRIDRVL